MAEAFDASQAEGTRFVKEVNEEMQGTNPQ
jgi:hypothetical protein